MIFSSLMPSASSAFRPILPLPYPVVSQPFYQQSYSNPGKPFDLQLIPASPIIPDQSDWLDLQIYNPITGSPPRLQIVHEKPAHIFIVNQDLSDFQHVHPEAMQPGLLRIPVNFKTPGTYKLFMQFTTPENGEQTLNKPFQVGSVQPPPKPMIPDAHLPKFVDGYTFRVTGLPTRQNPVSMFHIEISQNGVPVKKIQPYLGAGAHGVILSQDLQSFIHTHPMSESQNGFYQSPIMFHTQIDKPGLYKMWIQTQVEGKVRTVDWTFQV